MQAAEWLTLVLVTMKEDLALRGDGSGVGTVSNIAGCGGDLTMSACATWWEREKCLLGTAGMWWGWENSGNGAEWGEVLPCRSLI